MDSFNYCNIKLEKANAIKKHRQIQKIANLFRIVEICAVLALISRFSIGLPVAFKNSSEYFKDLTDILLSPRFVFIVGNVIVIVLFAKSGQFSGKDSDGKKSRNDFYEEFVQKSKRSQTMDKFEAAYRGKQCTTTQFIVPEKTCRSLDIKNYERIQPHEKVEKSLEIKNYQRSQSEKLEHANRNKYYRELRRIATEKYRGSGENSEGWVQISYPEDHMSNEEFRCTVEAFIARQKRIRREEENSV